MINKILKALGSEYQLVKKPNPRDLRNIIGGSNQNVSQQVLTNGNNPTFFGYHDKTPFSLDNKKVLANSVSVEDTKLSNEGSLMEVGYFKRDNKGRFSNHFKKIAETTVWSWQQGCMLQWNPNNANREVIFNTVRDQQYRSVIFDIEDNRVEKEFSFPIYSLDPCGKYAASLNFSRLSRIRSGYGCRVLPDSTVGSLSPSEDGVFIYDFNSGDQVAMISLETLAENTLTIKDHYINHITFSPDGKYICFFHIYSDTKSKRIIRFYLYDIDQKKLHLLEAFRTVSHYCWRNENQIITTENGPGGCHYYLYDIDKKTKHLIDIPNIGDLHPMVHPRDQNKIVADSKPDHWRKQHLFVFDIESGEHVYITSFKNQKQYNGPVRCDLHPRWDREGEYIAVDSTDKGKRNLIIINI